MNNLTRVSVALGAFACAASLQAGPGPRSSAQVRSSPQVRSAPSRPSTVRVAPSSRPSQARPSHGSPRGGGHHGGGGWHGGYGGRGHRGYGYGYGYNPWRWGWGGWGWGWGGYWGYAPGWYGGYYGGYYGMPYGYAPNGYVTYAPGAWAVVDTDVSPDETQVFLDGRLIGSADDFDGFPDYLYLKPGKYTLEFRLEGFEPQSTEVDARAGVKIDVGNKLKKIPGAKQYGSYDPPQPEGGVRRFWGKEKDGSSNSVEIETDESGYSDWRDPDRGSEGAPPIEPGADSPSRPADQDSPQPPRVSRPGAATADRGRIVFRVEPEDAAVYVDDRFAGTAEELSSLSRGLQVPAGTHRVVVSRPGYGSESLQVEVTAGESETVELRLDRPEGAN